MKKIVLGVLLPASFMVLVSIVVSFFMISDEEKYDLISPDSYDESSLYYVEGVGEVSLIFPKSNMNFRDLTQKVIVQKAVVDGKELVEFTQKEVSLKQVKKRVYSDYYLTLRKVFIVFVSVFITSLIVGAFFKKFYNEVNCDCYYCERKRHKRNE